jgi:large subunit ribosomal protein L25
MIMTIKAQARESYGKNASRRLRKQGLVPAVMYGEGTATLALSLDKKDIVRILKSESGENTLFKVGFGSEVRDAMIKELQTDPASDELLHVDLLRISMDKAIRVSVPVLLKGEAVGVKTEGGFVDFITRDLEVECLPGDIPENIELDVSALHLHQSAKVGELLPPQGVKIISDPNTVLVLIDLPKEEAVKKEGEEEVAAVAEEKAEPEVIKKERAEKEKEEPEKPEKPGKTEKPEKKEREKEK